MLSSFRSLCPTFDLWQKSRAMMSCWKYHLQEGNGNTEMIRTRPGGRSARHLIRFTGNSCYQNAGWVLFEANG